MACHIGGLPEHLLEEILLQSQIFPYLPGGMASMAVPHSRHALLPPIGAVCQRWRDLVFSSPKLWHHVHVKMPNRRQRRPDVIAILHLKAPLISILDVYGDANRRSRVLTKFPSFPNVETLRFNITPKVTPMEFDLMAELFPSVKIFDVGVDVNYLGNETLQLLAASWPNLVDFRVSQRQQVTAAGLIRFVSIANRLESLNINRVYDLTDYHVEEITELLGRRLKSISIGIYQYHLSGVAVESIVANCPLLENIFIGRPINIGYLKHLPNLKSLRIDFNPYRGQINNVNADCEGLADCFYRPFSQLRVLQVVGVQNLTDSFLTHVANSCPLLEIFHLELADHQDNYSRSITDSGLDQIVAKCRNLTDFLFAGFPLLTGRSFIGAKDKLPRLRCPLFKRCPNVDPAAFRGDFSDENQSVMAFWCANTFHIYVNV